MSSRSPFVCLNPGDPIDVVAPSSACRREDLESGLRVLEAWGFVPRVPPDLFGRPYIYAHDDRVRWAQLRRALTRSDARAVWCVRGGYGSARLLPYLQRLRRRPPRKLLVGFSDASALLNFVVDRWAWSPLHGPVVSQLGREGLADGSLCELRAVVSGGCSQLGFPKLRALNEPARRPGSCAGVLVGGNLKTIQSLAGTPFALRSNRRLVVLEDTGERGYAVDRMLTQLTQAGMLRGARAVIFGRFGGGDEPDGSNRIAEVQRAFAESFEKPVLDGLDIGHHRTARAMPLGLRGELTLGPRPALDIAWTPDPAGPRSPGRPSAGAVTRS